MADDDPPDVPREDVESELAKAEQMLADATKAHEVGISTATIVNRLYYAFSTRPGPPSTRAGSIPGPTAGFRRCSAAN